jgi:hypothetical protein
MANKDNPRNGSNFEALALSVFARLGLPSAKMAIWNEASDFFGA